MAGFKENLPPTPRALRSPLASNVRPLSPSDKPALHRQRDHSACRRPDTPLRVRKTRENLKNDERLGDVPPPCVGCTNVEDEPSDSLDTTLYNSLSPVSSRTLHAPDILRSTSPEPLAPPQYTDGKLAEQPKLARHRSVSKRMLSSLKSAATRTRSTNAIRPMESEASLLRRISGRRKPTNGPQPERRAYSFDVSRDSVASDIDHRDYPVDTAFCHNPPKLDQRSFTESTVSTTALVQELESITPPFGTPISAEVAFKRRYSSAPESPPPKHPAIFELTPSPADRTTTPGTELAKPPFAVPFVRLGVAMDTQVVDYGEKRNIWIAIEATVDTHLVDLPQEGQQPSNFKQGRSTSLGAITSLRICYKPSCGSKILDLVGRKSTKDLLPGESCLLFMKLHVPRIRPSNSTQAEDDIDQESLFAELQSIVGTLEQDVLHVEARYKHSLIPDTNTLTCRVACRLRRPNTDSRWSICSSSDGQSGGSNVHERLSKYIISQCPPQEALDLIHHHLGVVAAARYPVDELCVALEIQLREKTSGPDDPVLDKPSILISDTSLEPESVIASPAPSEPFSPISDSASIAPTSTISHSTLLTATPARPSKRRLSTTVTTTHPLISAAKVTTAVSNSHSKASTPDLGNGSDDARALWKHIRQSSLSTMQKLVESNPETLAHLEETDEIVKELGKKALANKRSVGAETLRAWRWDERRNQGGVAPWM